MPAPEKSKDLIPLDTISLSEAFRVLCQLLVPDWGVLNKNYETNANTGQETEPTRAALDAEKRKVDLKFRAAMATGRPATYCRDPETGELLRVLNPEDWNKSSNFGPPGFVSDFVSPHDLLQPGPDTCIRGKQRPVVLKRDEFEKYLRDTVPGYGAPASPSGGGVGRPSWMKDIEALLDQWIAGGKSRIQQEVFKWGEPAGKPIGKASIARALDKCFEKANPQATKLPNAGTIKKQLSAKIKDAFRLVESD